MHLRVNAMNNVTWDDDTQQLYADNLASEGLRLSSMQTTLYGQCLLRKGPVIVNNRRPSAAEESHTTTATGLPPGHPALDHFLGIPIFCHHEIVGMMGITNRPGGYTEADLQYLEPFTLACSSLMQSYQQMDTNQDLINTLESKVRERTQKLEQANADLAAANAKVVQASQKQLQHFACMSHELRTYVVC